MGDNSYLIGCYTLIVKGSACACWLSRGAGSCRGNRRRKYFCRTRYLVAKELGKRVSGHTIYLLDEPTTGLHPHDVKKLIALLYELVDQGNTVITVEHNLDVIAMSDWVIDFGPEGGDAGGEIIAQGTPETVAEIADSQTGTFLKANFFASKVKN
jgi:Excinuclease ATPase subunit